MNDLNDRRYNQKADRFIMVDCLQMENAPNYNTWLYELVKPFIGDRVLEIGSGTGTISQKVIEDVDLLVGIEPNKYCSDILLKTLKYDQRFSLINKSIEECDYHDLKQYQFDTILSINVLEHIEDDVDALLLMEKILDPGGRVVLLVPAFPQAYGPIDKAVGHFRRYSKTSMKEVVGKTSLKIENLFYSNLLGLLGWFFNSRIRRSTSQKDSQINLFNKIVPLISSIENKFGCPVGLSLISVSRKIK